MRTIFDRINTFFFLVVGVWCWWRFSGETLHEHTSSIYGEASERIAQITRQGDCLVLKIAVPLYVIPTILQSYWQYYRMGMGMHAFRLPLCASWVQCSEMGRNDGQSQGNYRFSELFLGFLMSGEHRPLTSALWFFKRCSCILLHWILFVFLSDFWPTARIWSHLSLISWAI